MVRSTILLASRSPRRRQLLEQIGIPYRELCIAIDETRRHRESPGDYVVRMARSKARAGLAAADCDAPVLAADTAVVLGDRVFGKPADRADGMAMLLALAGRKHRVMSAVTVADGERMASRLQVSEVSLASITPAEAHRYWETGEPADKAGGYAIQGRAAVFVTHLSGSYSGVMGLPLWETARLLGEFAVQVS